MKMAEAGAFQAQDPSIIKHGFITETKTNTRWYAVLRRESLNLHESPAAASSDDQPPGKLISIGVCSNVKLGGLLQNTLKLKTESETKSFSLWSDFATSMEFRCKDAGQCNGWFNSVGRIVHETRQVELVAMAQAGADDIDMQMRFRHARLWAMEAISAPKPLPRSQWTASHAVSACAYCAVR